MKELKPCPFCEATPEKHPKDKNYLIIKHKERCFIEAVNVIVSVDDWNTRPAPSKQALDPSPRAGCKLAGKGRGDCKHFIGVPEVLNDKTTDCYGVPNGWCDYCWLAYRLENQSPRAGLSLTELREIVAGRYNCNCEHCYGRQEAIVKAIHSAQPSDRTVGEIWEKAFKDFRKWLVSGEPRHMAHMQAECARQVRAVEALISKHTTGKE